MSSALGLRVPTYGLFLLVAGVVVHWAAFQTTSRAGLQPWRTNMALLALAVPAFAGGRIQYILSTWELVGYGLGEALAFWRGFHAFGALAGVAVGVPVAARIAGVRLGQFLELTAAPLLLGVVVARLGCFLNGCCFGTVCTLLFCVRFPQGSHPFQLHVMQGLIARESPTSLGIHPLPLYFALAALVGIAAARFVAPRRRFEGEAALIGLTVYLVLAAAVEPLRASYYPSAYVWGGRLQFEWLAWLLAGVVGSTAMAIELRLRFRWLSRVRAPLAVPSSTGTLFCVACSLFFVGASSNLAAAATLSDDFSTDPFVTRWCERFHNVHWDNNSQSTTYQSMNGSDGTCCGGIFACGACQAVSGQGGPCCTCDSSPTNNCSTAPGCKHLLISQTEFVGSQRKAAVQLSLQTHLNHVCRAECAGCPFEHAKVVAAAHPNCAAEVSAIAVRLDNGQGTGGQYAVKVQLHSEALAGHPECTSLDESSQPDDGAKFDFVVPSTARYELAVETSVNSGLSALSAVATVTDVTTSTVVATAQKTDFTLPAWYDTAGQGRRLAIGGSRSAALSFDNVQAASGCTRVVATISADFASGTYPDLAGLVVDLEYPHAKLAIPGTLSDPSVAERVEGLVGGLVSLGDADSDNDGIDDTATIATVAISPSIPDGANVARVTFDCLSGVETVPASDFTCTVTEGSTSTGSPVLGTTCAVVVSTQ